jgi:hypothetical protein
MTSPSESTEAVQAVATPDPVAHQSGIIERGLNIVGAAPIGPIDAAAANAYLQSPTPAPAAPAFAPAPEAPATSGSD